MQTHTLSYIIKPVVFLACLIPFGMLGYNIYIDNLGANPIETITLETGTWALRFLVITLLITPLRKLTGAHWLLRLRRMFGLYVFFYASLHFITFIWFDHFFDITEMLMDIVERPFITVGFACYLMLIPLALTSTNKMIKRLGGRRWQLLHRLVYVIAAGSVLHYFWKVKFDTRAPIIYAAIFAVLLLYRYWTAQQKQAAS